MRQRAAALSVVLVALAGCGAIEGERDTTLNLSCKAVTEQEVSQLFSRWNHSLQTGDPVQVVDNYAPRSILLPTASDQIRVTRKEKEDYFKYFLRNKPAGTVTFSQIDIGCNTVVDSGLYTFVFAKTGDQVKARYTYTYQWDGKKWVITSHHSSVVPQ